MVAPAAPAAPASPAATTVCPSLQAFPHQPTQMKASMLCGKDLRSVVMSRLAFRMCRHFNGKEEIEVDQAVSDGCDTLFSSVLSTETQHQANTRESARMYPGLPPRSPSPPSTAPESAGETKITKKLAEKMREFISALDVADADQWQLNRNVSGERKTAGRTDITFVKPKPLKAASQQSEENERDVIALLEVGIQTTDVSNDFSLWMSKLGQGSRYLKEMAKDGTTGPVNSRIKNVDGNPKFRGPALLGIVTFNKKMTFMNVGVFCCEPLDRPDSVRMALMYREQVNAREQMAKAFAKMVKGIVAFNSVRDLPNDFTYLGPNCAKVMVGDQVTVSLCLGIVMRFTVSSEAIPHCLGAHPINRCFELMTIAPGAHQDHHKCIWNTLTRWI